jgi:hypothetical protein
MGGELHGQSRAHAQGRETDLRRGPADGISYRFHKSKKLKYGNAEMLKKTRF